MSTTSTATLSALAQTIARELVQAHRTGVAWNPGSFDTALSTDDGYRIQDLVAAELGWFASGQAAAWKAGGKAPNMSGSPLPVVLPSGSSWSSAGTQGLAMEAEVAVRLARTPTGPQDVLDCIGGLCVSIELVGTRLQGGMEAPGPWKFADQQVHAVLVTGPEIPFSPRDWAAQSFEVQINGTSAGKGTGTAANGDPLSTLPWLFDHAIRRGLPLRAGDLITTGAWAVIPVKAGDRIRTTFDGIGEAEVTCS
ncbi:MAG: fumarylacetoacetate hydrolase family protein [Polaromonas sp.]|nr:fumarylacetoacetate hydrolase family protein [Polaromonas sp.]